MFGELEMELELETLERELLLVKARQAERKVEYCKVEKMTRYWTKEERQRFESALKMFGTNFSAIATYVGTRNSTQVRTHAQKYFAKLVRDCKRSGQEEGKQVSPLNANLQ